MYHSIVGLIKRKNADLSKDSIKYLNKLASKFARAIDNRRGGVKLSDIGSMDDEREENESNERYTYIGVSNDGRKIYKSNYEENTPKQVKQQDIINLVQEVWSQKPIELTIIEDGKTRKIIAHFNPELSERSDLSKIAFGNRKGTGSEKRITLNLSSDLYQIAQDSVYVKSKDETGKDNKAHSNVKRWHYFVTNLIYEEKSGEKI